MEKLQTVFSYCYRELLLLPGWKGVGVMLIGIQQTPLHSSRPNSDVTSLGSLPDLFLPTGNKSYLPPSALWLLLAPPLAELKMEPAGRTSMWFAEAQPITQSRVQKGFRAEILWHHGIGIFSSVLCCRYCSYSHYTDEETGGLEKSRWLA